MLDTEGMGFQGVWALWIQTYMQCLRYGEHVGLGMCGCKDIGVYR